MIQDTPQLERDAQTMRRKILELCRQENVPSDVLVMALSDVLGDTAAMLDRCTGYQPIEARLNVVMVRAKHTYGRAQAGIGLHCA